MHRRKPNGLGAWPRTVAIVASMLVTGVCAQPAASAPAMIPSVHGAWKIVQARTEPILDQRQARLDLGADGRLGGHTSCNTMSAPYTLDGPQIRIGPIVTTRMACSPLRLEQEDRILTALESAVTAIVRGDGLLEIRDSDGRGLLRALRFDAAAEPTEPAAPSPATTPEPPKEPVKAATWPVVGRQGLIQIVIVPTSAVRDRKAYDREIAAICQPELSCFINFYSNSTDAPVVVPLPDAIANEATVVFRRSIKQAGEFFRWNCKLGLPENDCF